MSPSCWHGVLAPQAAAAEVVGCHSVSELQLAPDRVCLLPAARIKAHELRSKGKEELTGQVRSLLLAQHICWLHTRRHATLMREPAQDVVTLPGD